MKIQNKKAMTEMFGLLLIVFTATLGSYLVIQHETVSVAARTREYQNANSIYKDQLGAEDFYADAVSDELKKYVSEYTIIDEKRYKCCVDKTGASWSADARKWLPIDEDCDDYSYTGEDGTTRELFRHWPDQCHVFTDQKCPDDVCGDNNGAMINNKNENGYCECRGEERFCPYKIYPNSELGKVKNSVKADVNARLAIVNYKYKSYDLPKLKVDRTSRSRNKLEITLGLETSLKLSPTEGEHMIVAVSNPKFSLRASATTTEPDLYVDEPKFRKTSEGPELVFLKPGENAFLGIDTVNIGCGDTGSGWTYKLSDENDCVGDATPLNPVKKYKCCADKGDASWHADARKWLLEAENCGDYSYVGDDGVERTLYRTLADQCDVYPARGSCSQLCDGGILVNGNIQAGYCECGSVGGKLEVGYSKQSFTLSNWNVPQRGQYKRYRFCADTTDTIDEIDETNNEITFLVPTVDVNGWFKKSDRADFKEMWWYVDEEIDSITAKLVTDLSQWWCCIDENGWYSIERVDCDRHGDDLWHCWNDVTDETSWVDDESDCDAEVDIWTTDKARCIEEGPLGEEPAAPIVTLKFHDENDEVVDTYEYPYEELKTYEFTKIGTITKKLCCDAGSWLAFKDRLPETTNHHKVGEPPGDDEARFHPNQPKCGRKTCYEKCVSDGYDTGVESVSDGYAGSCDTWRHCKCTKERVSRNIKYIEIDMRIGFGNEFTFDKTASKVAVMKDGKCVNWNDSLPCPGTSKCVRNWPQEVKWADNDYNEYHAICPTNRPYCKADTKECCKEGRTDCEQVCAGHSDCTGWDMSCLSISGAPKKCVKCWEYMHAEEEDHCRKCHEVGGSINASDRGCYCNDAGVEIDPTSEVCGGGGGAAQCTDTDATGEYPDGKNYYVKGTTTGPGESTDRCLSVRSIREWYCNNDVRDFDDHACGLGYECKDDACISLTCTDSDATGEYPRGNNPYVAGTARLGDVLEQSDVCIHVQLLRERYCAGDKIDFEDIQCNRFTPRHKCENNACVPE